MKKKLSDPNAFCPICDKAMKGGHRCSAADLAAIDRSSQTNPDDGRVMTLPAWQRLSMGFRMMTACETGA